LTAGDERVEPEGMTVLAGIPLKGFDVAKGRLADHLSPEVRSEVAESTARRVVDAARNAGFRVVVVTASPQVRAWTDAVGVACLDDPPQGGLDAAASVVVDAADGPWCVIHGDLPLVTHADLEPVAGLLAEGRAVLAPSRDGGTNLVAAPVPVSLAYGPGSFARHLAATAALRPAVLVTVGLAVELDTVGDLTAAARLPGGSWLEPFLA
jgi:2-phospho-L-lactate/phosphoenolpyruvate guanylyltransferase